MVEILEPDDIEASFAMEGTDGSGWWFHIAKVGGGTIGKEYSGEWMFLADEKGGQRTYSGEFRTNIPRDHAEAAVVGWNLVSGEYGL